MSLFALMAHAQTPAPESARGGAASPEYIIGPGDALDVFVWRNQELSTRVPVRPDGRISTPLVEDMVAIGKTPTQLARDIEAVLAEFVRTPKVNIIVTNAASANSQIRVVGQAVTPRAIPYRDGLTVMDVVIAVGGLSEFAAGNRAKIMRQRPGGEVATIKVRLRDLLDKGDLKQNHLMEPGDVLVIPESRF
jgi:polysaccharide export outer membrane protein